MKKNNISQVTGKIKRDVRKASISGLREAARQVRDDLFEASPATSGYFRSRWYTQVSGGSKVFYGLSQDPDRTAPIVRKNVSERTTIFIGNDDPDATIAMDLTPGKFEYAGSPAKAPVEKGFRPDGALRGALVPGEGSYSTAELNWYSSYMNQNFRGAVRKGAKRGYIKLQNPFEG